MAKGFEIETALAAPFSLAKRRPVTVFAWGLLSLLPILPMFGVFIPIWAVAAQTGAPPSDEMVGEMMMANVSIQLGQLLQWITTVLVVTAAIRAVLANPKASPKPPFYLGFGMPELMVAVSWIAICIVLYGALILFALVGVGVGFAVWGLGSPWNVLAIVLYGLICVGFILWLALRLSLVCAAAVDRRTLELPAAWRATKGQVGKLLLLCLLLWLASIAVTLIFVAVMAPFGFGVFFASGLRFEMFGEGQPLPVLTPASWAIVSIGGLVFAFAAFWFTGLSQVLWAAPFASVWKQIQDRAAAKAADAAARDALGSPEL